MNSALIADLELTVIGCLLDGGTAAVDTALEALPSGAFEREDCHRAWEIIRQRHEDGLTTDTAILYQEWKERSGDESVPLDIITSPNVVEHISQLPHYLQMLTDRITHRQKKDLMARLEQMATSDNSTLSEMRAAFDSIVEQTVEKNIAACDGQQASRQLINDLERRYSLQGKHSGVVTGFGKLDRILDGLQYGELTVVGARPSQGKSALGLAVAEQAAIVDQVPTLFVTMEMSIPALMRRLLAMNKNIPLTAIKQGQMTEVQFTMATGFVSLVNQRPLYFLDHVAGVAIDRLTAEIRSQCRRHDIQLVVVDYLQKIKASERNEKRCYEVASVSQRLKSIAVQTNTAVLCMAQLNREPDREKNRPPRLADLADSSQIERDADSVLLLQLDKETGEAKLWIAKNRDGEIGCCDLYLNGPYVRYENAYFDLPPTRQGDNIP